MPPLRACSLEFCRVVNSRRRPAITEKSSSIVQKRETPSSSYNKNLPIANMPSALFINRVFPPDGGATGQLLAELAERLVRENWSVTILASSCDRAEGCADAAMPEVRMVGVGAAA